MQLYSPNFLSSVGLATHVRGGEEMDSILNTIKKMLGIDSNYDAFDTDIIVHINSAIMILRQLGIGPPDGFIVSDESDSWSDLIGEGTTLYESIKTYIYLKVKSVFDPSTSSAANEASKEMIKELEWRLNSESENTTSPKSTNE